MNKALIISFASTLVLGCSQPVEEVVAEATSPIVGGEPDTEHDAVVFLFSAGCTGTIIHRDGSEAYVLTAAHCVRDGDLIGVVGDSITNSPPEEDIFRVSEVRMHPAFTNDPGSDGNIALLHVLDLQADVGCISPLTPDEDMLEVGSEVVHVGYGGDATGSGSGTRKQATSSITDLTATMITYDFDPGGPCGADGGGPQLVTVEGEERVAGITAYGNGNCDMFGSGPRVSGYYEDFILDTLPSELKCDAGSASGKGGGGGAGQGGGGGGTAPNPTTSDAGGCSAAAGTSSSAWGWLLIGAGWVLGRRRRS